MLDIQKLIGSPKIVVSELDDRVTKLEVKYLPRGFGHSLGNALRRIILGYSIGAAVTGIKIKGVSHEYHVVDGVLENVIGIMLNFKTLRFNFDENIDSIQWISQRFSGVGVYTAKDIKLPAGVELLNPEVHLFEITDPSVELNMDIRIEKGYGYYSIDFLRSRDKKEDSDVNILLIDNEFKLVDSIKYEVEEVIEDFTGSTKDLLVLEIKTGYSGVSAKEIVMFAGEILASYAKLFVFDNVYIDRSVMVDMDDLVQETARTEHEIGVKTMPIDALPLSERTRNALIKNNILYVEDLEKKKKGELLLMKGVGRKAIDEIVSSLANINKSLIG
ncbi:MAG: DNA-directed RNA polymerase subunit alpha C-terminal domain-containing protein [Candidatus Absconditabacteria bacterium]|nr:DNA-directed RNA polymerase subunit alpha C-terminal domain-containing protein [Candidatus Absconditabacteria bacterium]